MLTESKGSQLVFCKRTHLKLVGPESLSIARPNSRRWMFATGKGDTPYDDLMARAGLSQGAFRPKPFPTPSCEPTHLRRPYHQPLGRLNIHTFLAHVEETQTSTGLAKAAAHGAAASSIGPNVHDDPPLQRHDIPAAMQTACARYTNPRKCENTNP